MRKNESFLGVPIRYAGNILGVIEVGSPNKSAFTEDDEHLLQALADQIGIFVRTSRDRKNFISIIGKNNPQELANAITRQVPNLVGGIGCSVFIKRPGEENAKLFASNEFLIEQKNQVFYAPGEGYTGWVLEQGKGVIIPRGENIRKVPFDEYPGMKWMGKHIGLDPVKKDRSSSPWIGAPLKDSRGDVLGVIRISDKQEGSFTQQDLTLLQACADSIAFVIESQEFLSTLDRIDKGSEKVQELLLELQKNQCDLLTKEYFISELKSQVNILQSEHKNIEKQAQEIVELNKREVKYLLGAVIAAGAFVMLLSFIAFHILKS